VLRGEMAERLKAHAWKACVPKGTVGSNPTLSANQSANAETRRLEREPARYFPRFRGVFGRAPSRIPSGDDPAADPIAPKPRVFSAADCRGSIRDTGMAARPFIPGARSPSCAGSSDTGRAPATRPRERAPANGDRKFNTSGSSSPPSVGRAPAVHHGGGSVLMSHGGKFF
jgi:hypothetical protein